MWTPTIIMGAIAVLLLAIGYFGGKGQHLSGLRIALTTTLQVLPMLVCAFIVSGMVQALVPREALSRWIGAGSGMRGILIGALAGGLTPGGPYVSLPVAAGLLQSGASVGTVVAFIVGWSLSTLVFPPLAGLVANLLAVRFG